MISVSAPGKLYIAGEYAVVEPGHHAVLVAVDRFITVRVTLAEHAGHIISDLYATRSLTWRRRLEDDVLEVEEQFDDYVVSAIRVVEQMVREAGGTMQFFDLEVSSELGDDSGRKLGLGSSSAVTVATVRAVAGFYGLPLDDLAVYKLALLASYAVQPIGSGGDIAASALIIAYIPLMGVFIPLMMAEPGGTRRIIAVVACVVASDTGAYAVGSLLGKHKMAPHISPSKTWEGFAGSIATSAVIGVAAALWCLGASWELGLVLGLCIAPAATLGDLVESLIKRDAGLKDMSNFLPGHGGFMDRLDSMLVAMPMGWLVLHLGMGG